MKNQIDVRISFNSPWKLANGFAETAWNKQSWQFIYMVFSESISLVYAQEKLNK